MQIQAGVKAGLLTSYRLKYQYSESRLKGIDGIIRLARQINPALERVKAPSADILPKDFDFSQVPVEIVKTCIAGNVLDLRYIHLKMQGYLAHSGQIGAVNNPFTLPAVAPEKINREGENARDRILQLLDVIADERNYFEKLAYNPSATIDKVFKAIDHGKTKLGFLNVTVYRPKEDGSGNWVITQRTRRWENELSRYDPGLGGAEPSATLASVINGKKIVYDVDISDLDRVIRAKYGISLMDLPDDCGQWPFDPKDLPPLPSFEKEGLTPDIKSIINYFKAATGPKRMLFIKMQSIHGVEAVIHLHNLVKPEEKIDPPPLLPEDNEDAERVKGGLIYYFDKAVRAMEVIRAREGQSVRKEDLEERGFGFISLSGPAKKAILNRGQRLEHQGQTVRIYEVPLEKFYKQMDALIEWLRDVILSVYEGTSIARGKNRSELIHALSLEDGMMLERLIYSRYLALIEGDEGREGDLKGVISGTVLDMNEVRGGIVFRIPEAMIRKEGRGRKLEVAVSYILSMRVVRKLWAEMGLIKGFFHMLTNGVPFYATTQSLRVIKDMLRLKNLSLLRIAQGKALTEEQRKIVELGSNGKADASGIERNAYVGRIAIDEEEKDVVLRKPSFFGNKKSREDKELKRIFKEEIGKNGRVHLVGYLTIGVALKVGLELLWTSLFRKKHESR